MSLSTSSSSSEPNDDEPEEAPPVVAPIYLKHTSNYSSSSEENSLTEEAPAGDSGEEEEQDNVDEFQDAPPEGHPAISPRTPSTESVGSTSVTSAGVGIPNFTLCRLCRLLTSKGLKTCQDMFANNPQLGDVYLSEATLCACPPEMQSEKVHSICLQRWTRQTGDKPCPRCRTHFHAPSHLTRLNGFLQILSLHFATEFVVTMWLLNVWLLRDLFWTMFTEWSRLDYAETYETLAWIFGRIRWNEFLFGVVPFMNLFVLQYFYLLYRAIRVDYELLLFTYKNGPVEATQLYSALLVAERSVSNQGALKPGALNYGPLWNYCSHCGQALTLKPYFRYLCNCFGYHEECLRMIIPTNPSAAILSRSPSSRCPNCSTFFQFTFRPYLYLVRDVLLMPRSRSLTIFGDPVQTRTLQTTSADCRMPRREPSFASYLFRTRLGRPKVLKFSAVLVLYLLGELAISALKYAPPAETPVTNLVDLGAYLTTVWDNFESASGAESQQMNLWLLLRLLWFICEFLRIVHGDYLEDFDRHQAQLQSYYVF